MQMFGSRSFLYADSMFALAKITRKVGVELWMGVGMQVWGQAWGADGPVSP